jgi:hypothetical protein
MNLGEMRVDVTRRVYLFYKYLFILSHSHIPTCRMNQLLPLITHTFVHRYIDIYR